MAVVMWMVRECTGQRGDGYCCSGCSEEIGSRIMAWASKSTWTEGYGGKLEFYGAVAVSRLESGRETIRAQLSWITRDCDGSWKLEGAAQRAAGTEKLGEEAGKHL